MSLTPPEERVQNRKVSLTELYRLYCKLNYNKEISEFEQGHGLAERGINVRKFITFGLINGFVRRIHEWPVRDDKTARVPLPLQWLVPYLNGKHNMDEICVYFSAHKPPGFKV